MAINGIQGGFNYRGVNAPNPPNVYTYKRAPTVFDGTDFLIGDLWQYQINTGTDTNPNYTASKIFHLVQQTLGINYWVEITGVGTATSINYQYFTTPGTFTYTPTTGMFQCVVECIGGGGATGAVYGVIAGLKIPASSGGGGSGYCKRLFSYADIGSSQIVTVGAGGPVTMAFDRGASGGNSTFGSFMTSNGGTGAGLNGGGPGGEGIGGDINVHGGFGQSFVPIPPGITTPPWYLFGGAAGSVGGGWGIGGGWGCGDPNYTQAQTPGSGYGSSASGYAWNQTTAPSVEFGLGGNDGIVIITEYIHL